MMCICCFATWGQQGKDRIASRPQFTAITTSLIRLAPASFSNPEFGVWHVTSAIASDSVSFEADAR